MDALIFVYNADSGFFNALSDYLHKTFSPNTYRCNLCAITHGARMHDEWRAFIESLPVPVLFLHRDELAAQFGIADIALPAVFAKTDNTLQRVISAAEIDRAKNIADLEALVVSGITKATDNRQR